MQAAVSTNSATQAEVYVASTAQQEQVLTFVLGRETYGLDILRVQEIRGWEAPTQLPQMPHYVKGVINMRGAVIPIVDLRQRFEIGQPTYDESTVVIITKMQATDKIEGKRIEKTIGMVVDGVSDVESVDMAQLQPAPAFSEAGQVGEQFIKGLANVTQNSDAEDKMIIVLNVDALIHQGIFNQLKH